MLLFKSFHIIALVAWFSGLFYLPRLFVYHASTTDEISDKRFLIMERRLYYGIIWPAGIATTLFGFLLISTNYTYYMHARWMQFKFLFVALLWVYHLSCGYYRKNFEKKSNKKSTTFFRFYNEAPTLLLIIIVLLVVLKPF